MFDVIAPTYDEVNAILSLGIHTLWNRTFVRMLGPATHLVDLCAGTGKVALHYIQRYPSATATLVDFSSGMLDIVKHNHPNAPFTYIEGDITKLPLPSSSETLMSMAYGLRNLVEPENTLKELSRVLIPGGILGILELTAPPRYHPLHFLHTCYLSTIVPWIGRYYQHGSAYAYLSESIQKLPQDRTLETLFQSEGFHVEKKKKLLFGSATIWILKKQQA